MSVWDKGSVCSVWCYILLYVLSFANVIISGDDPVYVLLPSKREKSQVWQVAGLFELVCFVRPELSTFLGHMESWNTSCERVSDCDVLKRVTTGQYLPYRPRPTKCTAGLSFPSHAGTGRCSQFLLGKLSKQSRNCILPFCQLLSLRKCHSCQNYEDIIQHNVEK